MKSSISNVLVISNMAGMHRMTSQVLDQIRHGFFKFFSRIQLLGNNDYTLLDNNSTSISFRSASLQDGKKMVGIWCKIIESNIEWGTNCTT